MFNVLAFGKLTGEVAAANYAYDLTRLGFPAGAKRVRLQVWNGGSPIEFYHGLPDANNRDAGRVFQPYGIVEVIPSADGKCYVGPPGAVFDVSPLGWFS